MLNDVTSWRRTTAPTSHRIETDFPGLTTIVDAGGKDSPMSCARTLCELTLVAACTFAAARPLAADDPYFPADDFGHAPFTDVDASPAVPPLDADADATEHYDVPSDSVIDPMAPEEVFPPAVYQDPAYEGPIRLRELFPMFDEHPTLECLAPISEECRTNGLWYFVDYDAFRGPPEGSWENNGIRIGFNYGTKLGQFSDLTGIGAQVGASIGVYDWGGTDYRQKNKNKPLTQGFFTYGLFRRPNEQSALTAALVQDWMFSDTFSVFGENPTLSQLRGQIGYAVNASNEFGVAGTAWVVSDSRIVAGFGHTVWRPINTLTGYWHHKWHRGGPDTWINIGVPEKTRLKGGGSVGDWLVSATALAPLSNAVSLYANVMYMHQSAGAGPAGANDEIWNFIVGISIYPRRNSRTNTVAGERWMPLLPTANNGTFIIDASNYY